MNIEGFNLIFSIPFHIYLLFIVILIKKDLKDDVAKWTKKKDFFCHDIKTS